MSAYLSHPEIWQESWDRQQEAFLPDRDQRFSAMLDAVAAVTDGGPPRVLDLAGGTGSISLRTLARFPGASVTVVDQDPVLLAIARSSLRGRGTIVDADLNDPAWRSKLPEAHRFGPASEPPDPTTPNSTRPGSTPVPGRAEGSFDAVLTATALHWLPAERVAALYGEIREVVRPGGIFVNADHMPEESLPTFSGRLRTHARAQREARYASGAATSWRDWWKAAAGHEFLAPRVAERERVYPAERHGQEWTPPAVWHVDAMRAAGFREAGVLWRGGTDAAVIGLR